MQISIRKKEKTVGKSRDLKPLVFSISCVGTLWVMFEVVLRFAR